MYGTNTLDLPKAHVQNKKSDTRMAASVLVSSLTHLLPISLTFSLCTPLPGSFVLLQTHGHFVSPLLEQKSLANAVSPTVLQSNGIHSRLTSVTFSPHTPSKLR